MLCPVLEMAHLRTQYSGREGEGRLFYADKIQDEIPVEPDKAVKLGLE
jgi:hypothetical protein